MRRTSFPLRHAVAVLAYRAGKVLRGATSDFAEYKAGPGTRTPAEILAHIGDLLDWALSLADGKEVWHNSPPGPWQAEVERFFGALRRFDRRLGSKKAPRSAPEKLFQGPIADALTHVGQIALLRRMAGFPVRGENYFLAKIAVGRVGAKQKAPVREFD